MMYLESNDLESSDLESTICHPLQTFQGYQVSCGSERPQAWQGGQAGAIEVVVPLSETGVDIDWRSPEGEQHRSPLQMGQVCIIPAQASYRLHRQRSARLICFYLDASFLYQMSQGIVAHQGFEIKGQYAVEDLLIQEIGLRFMAEMESQTAMGRRYLETLVNLLAVHLIRRYSVQQAAVEARPETDLPEQVSQYQLRRAIEYIQTHLDQEIQVADLARQLHLSPYYFCRLFKQAVGLSPYQYLLQQRIKRAKQLLKDYNLPIIDIAYQCGFSSPSHLSRYFKQQIGMTPRQYRRMEFQAIARPAG